MIKSSAKKWSQPLVGSSRLREVLYQRRGLGKFGVLDKVLINSGYWVPYEMWWHLEVRLQY